MVVMSPGFCNGRPQVLSNYNNNLMYNFCFREAGAGIHKIAGSDFGPRSDPKGEAQGCAESNLLTPTN